MNSISWTQKPSLFLRPGWGSRPDLASLPSQASAVLFLDLCLALGSLVASGAPSHMWCDSVDNWCSPSPSHSSKKRLRNQTPVVFRGFSGVVGSQLIQYELHETLCASLQHSSPKVLLFCLPTAQVHHSVSSLQQDLLSGPHGFCFCIFTSYPLC